MLQEDFTLRAGAARKARASIRRRLADLGVDDGHVLAVELVVAELMAAAFQGCRGGSTRLSLELFPLLTSVRLRCPADVEIAADELALRERLLGRLTVAVGRRRNVDGTVDMWAEVAHPVARVS
jgi:Fe2+ transport system protein FeoA